jgi:competence protein ComEA
MSTRSFKNWIPTLLATLLLAPLVQAEPVNVNTADATALAKALNGIGPAKAKAIVSYREKNGPFKSVDQLALVDGITQKLIDKNRTDIRLGNDKGGEKGADKPAAPSPGAAPAAKPAKPAS